MLGKMRYVHAYQALRAPNTVEPHLGLDRSLGQVCIRSLPIDRDEGYATAEQSGQGPNYPAIIQCLLQFQTRIRGKDMIYLIVDNRDPGEVPLKSGGSRAAGWWGHTMKTRMFCGLRPTWRMDFGGSPTTGLGYLYLR